MNKHKNMKILAVGGGSGGHVTPIAAVIRALQDQQGSTAIRVWTDRTFAPQAKSIIARVDPSVKLQTIVGGKLRRYHHLTFLQHFIIPSVLWPNLRDGLLVIIGTIQSFVKLLLWRPDVVFTKGGYVCLPVGWAANLLRIPVVIHDSDAHPGLTNRLLARRATAIATGAPLEYYSYPANKSHYVGIPVGDAFKALAPEARRSTKQSLGFDATHQLVVITGGGLGAKRINDTITLHLQRLLAKANVLLISGATQYDELRALTPEADDRFQLHAFVSDNMADILGAADVVVTRAGATTMLELAAVARPSIIVPNGRLTAGHQLKNAKVYADQNAAIIVDDETLDDPHSTVLIDAIELVLDDISLQQSLAKAIHGFAKPHAAKDMAAIIVRIAKKH
jgi:UDP-N-acetylglucosamine--N-acetylmuramyl-(pentapeptide) pyrophosphoryl-undecaprenol N-acetylglucosamine transferase